MNAPHTAAGSPQLAEVDQAIAREDAARAESRLDRLHIAFGMDGGSWDEEKVLERFELLYEAGLVEEAYTIAVRARLMRTAAQAATQLVWITGVPMGQPEEAERWGMVNRVLDDEELMPAVLEVAAQIAETSPEALPRIRAMMTDGWDMELGAALAMERERALPFNDAVDFAQMEQRLAQLRARTRNTSAN